MTIHAASAISDSSPRAPGDPGMGSRSMKTIAMMAPTPDRCFFVVEYILGSASGSLASFVGRKILKGAQACVQIGDRHPDRRHVDDPCQRGPAEPRADEADNKDGDGADLGCLAARVEPRKDGRNHRCAAHGQKGPARRDLESVQAPRSSGSQRYISALLTRVAEQTGFRMRDECSLGRVSKRSLGWLTTYAKVAPVVEQYSFCLTQLRKGRGRLSCCASQKRYRG
jgi:hypothetical protein